MIEILVGRLALDMFLAYKVQPHASGMSWSAVSPSPAVDVAADMFLAYMVAADMFLAYMVGRHGRPLTCW